MNENRAKTAIIILGASGDLAERKLLPALDQLYTQGHLALDEVIIGSGRSALTNDAFRAKSDCCPEFKALLFYHQGLAGLRANVDAKGTFERIVIFMALPPHAYEKTAKALYEEGFRDEVILVVEKPFGYDLTTSKKLNKELHRYYKESQIFRIDHYLAKEAVQNILVFRFANALFEPIWNNHYIEEIQVSAYEELSVENRGAYFDNSGIIRDMIQNHLIQLLAILTMESPTSLSAANIQHQKLNVLQQMKVEHWFRAQCDEYREEPGVANDSNTETYGAINLSINNSRWYGVPIKIRAGKYLNRKGTEIGVKFKKLPPILFNESGNLSENKIIFKIQPAEGIIIDIASKIPGSGEIKNTTMNFCYRDHFNEKIPEAYTKLLLDAINADKTLFVSAEESEISWEKFDACLKDTSPPHTFYKRGEQPDMSCEQEDCFEADWIKFEEYGNVC